jgi:uncharacterized membrane protein
MADWLEHTVQVEVNHPVDRVWDLWSSLELMPKWMKWIASVQIQPENPEISNWELGSGGFTFTWRSRILKQIPNQIIQWEAIDGLPNRGAIRFYGRTNTTVVKLTVSYAIPGVIGQIMDGLFLGKLVESTLQDDLERFRVYADQVINAESKTL